MMRAVSFSSFPNGVDILYVECPGVLRDVEQIKSLFELWYEVLNRLVHMDSAYEDDLGVRL